MDGSSFFVNAVLGMVALAAAGVLFVVWTGQVELPRAERTWLSAIAGIVLVAVIGFAAFS